VVVESLHPFAAYLQMLTGTIMDVMQPFYEVRHVVGRCCYDSYFRPWLPCSSLGTPKWQKTKSPELKLLTIHCD
jgi:hypothetical protein